MVGAKTIAIIMAAFVGGALTIIAADVIRGSESAGMDKLAGVNKIIFEVCDVDDIEGHIELAPRQTLGLTCNVEGSVRGDSVIATFNAVATCIDIEAAQSFEDTIRVIVENECPENAAVGVDSEISLVVFDK